MNRFFFSAFVGLALFVVPLARAQALPKFTRTEDVVYGQRNGVALTLDVFEPEKKNGAAVLWMVSSGFSSDRQRIKSDDFMPLIERGYTVFAVVHSSEPRFLIPEIEADVHRAVRYVRHNVQRWGIDLNRFGISGKSSGGQLALTIGTQGKRGDPAADDPIDRESSAVQAVACFFPPTDFLNWSKPGEYAPRAKVPVFWQGGTTRESQPEWGREISPIYFVEHDMPPTLVIHGDADDIVPLYQSLAFEQKCKAVGAPFKLIVKAGAGHSYPGWKKDMVMCADWFDEHLSAAQPKRQAPPMRLRE